MTNKLLLSVVITLLTTSCAVNSEASIDFNADVAAIADGVERFTTNSSLTQNVQNESEFVAILDENKNALNQIEIATKIFLRNINRASSRLPKVDNSDSPSESKLLAWANGYLTWIYYQRKSAAIGESCLSSDMGFVLCVTANYGKVSEYDSLSRIDLENAVAGIQEWRKSLGYE